MELKKELAFIIQARVTSSRLPNKIKLPFNGDKSILDEIIFRLKSKYNYKIIIATGEEEANMTLFDDADKHNVSFYKGSENDVLDRFIKASEHFGIKTIIRICSDNPFLDLNYIDKLLSEWDKDNLSYLSFYNNDKVPVIKTHLGLFSEIISLEALKKVKRYTSEPFFLEHVTNYIYMNPNKFNIKLIKAPVEVFNRGDLRFTVDDIEDFNNMKKLYQIYLKKECSIKKMISYLDEYGDEYKNKMNLNIKKYTK